MSPLFLRLLSAGVLFFLVASCANIVPPQGGPRDTTPPKLVSVSPPDSSLNTRVSTIELRFDEYITLNNATSEIAISPILPFPLTTEANGRRLTVRIPDTLLRDNTTYRISFGKAIQDLRENNPFSGYSYIFSTGSYFDSLALGGFVVNAVTGRRDTGAMVILHEAPASDSAVVRQKPQYAVKADASGNFRFTGLPAGPKKIFALRDVNNNLTYDGTDEMIAFYDTEVLPDTGGNQQIGLYLFSENDSLAASAAGTAPATSPRNRTGSGADNTNDQSFGYTVLADTTDIRRRTKELTSPLDIRFTRPLAAVNAARAALSFDSNGVEIEASIALLADTADRTLARIQTDWQENKVYTLRLLKGFAKDSAGNEALPSRHSFRTKRDEDYARLQVHLPSRFAGGAHIFQLLRDDKVIYHQTVRDTMVSFSRLEPGSFSMRVIEDENRNGKWDRGDLFLRRQPETVIPFNTPINLKPGWENLIDFEEQQRGKKGDNRPGATNPPK